MAKCLWQIPFKSFAGKSCRIDIYDASIPETAPLTPKTYKAGEDPFYCEEVDGDDLLNDVLHYHTGYIRMIDDGDINIPDIYPTSYTSRPVKVYYDGVMVFNGFIQPQDFDEQLITTPREIEFPVISCLGMFEYINFSPSSQNLVPARIMTLGALLDIVLAQSAYSSYDYVYMPDISDAYLSKTICTQVLTPWNDDYHPARIDYMNQLYSPESYAYLIEIICKAFGWICHDTPSALVFTMFDYHGNYIYYPKGHIGESGYKSTESVPATAVDLLDYFYNSDDNATRTTLLPETGIEIDYEGDSYTQDFCFDHCHYEDVITHPDWSATDGDEYSLCVFSPLTQIQEYTGIASPTFESSGYVTIGTYLVAWTSYKGILVSTSGQWSRGHQVATVRFYMKYPSASWRVSLDMLYASNGFVYQMSSVDTNSLMYGTVSYQNGYVEVEIRTKATFSNHELILIHGIHLECLMDNEPYTEYRYPTAEDADTLPSSEAYPVVTNSVDMPISLYRNNQNLIGTGTLSTKLTEYPYLFEPRKQIVQKFRLIDAPTLPHTRMFNYMGKRWRIVSQTFHPWDDEYELTLQHAPMLANL